MQEYKTINMPGDKSISHRILIIAALLNYAVEIKNISKSEDVKSTIRCLEQCGIAFTIKENHIYISKSNFVSPKKILFCGNSGTTARLLVGLLLNKGISAIITGDNSLLNRPMNRIIEPLKLMKANIISNNGYLPINISQSDLQPIHHSIKVPSAQVKSCLILAGHNLNSHNIVDTYKTRDHTEIMLNYFCSLKSKSNIKYNIPQDISSAAFIIALSIIKKKINIRINNLLFNPTPSGFVDILMKMNANIKISNLKHIHGELTCTLESSFSPNIKSINLDCFKNTNMIDEIPIFAVVSLFSSGETRVINAKELRLKECDRISAICLNLKNFGISVFERDDGFVISNKNILYDATIIHKNDHRIAMAFEILKVAVHGKLTHSYPNIINISFPDFYNVVEDCIV